MKRTGVIQLADGRYFYPLEPESDLITIEVLATALSNMCRYAGHCKAFYSVAQHCCHVHDQVPDKHKRWGLLHDADEGLGLPDVPRLVKYLPEMAFYRAAQTRLMMAICDRFGMEYDEPRAVKIADSRVLLTEWRTLKVRGFAIPGRARPYSWDITPWTPRRARSEFMRRWVRLNRLSAAPSRRCIAQR